MKVATLFHVYSVLALTAGLTLSGCQKSRQNESGAGRSGARGAPGTSGTPNGSPSPSTPFPSPGTSTPATPSVGGSTPPQMLDGTGDVGGGNGINGRVLEGYHVRDLRDLEAYKKYLKPKFDAMAKNSHPNPKDDERSMREESLGRTLNSKTWYIAPVKLKTIDNKVLGLSFSEHSTEQLAAQTQREVWISKEAFDKMSLQEQAELIAHEFFMSVYLWKFETGENLCRILWYSRNGLDCSKVKGPLSLPPEPARRLNEQDYAQIRAMTAWFLSQDEKLTDQLLNQKMGVLGFDPRFAGSRSEGPSFVAEVDRELTLKEVYIRMKQGLEKGLFEAKCSSNFDGVPASFPCQLELGAITARPELEKSYLKEAMDWRLKSSHEIRGTALLDWNSNMRMGYNTPSYKLTSHGLGNYYQMLQTGMMKEGQRFLELNIVMKKSTPWKDFLQVDVAGILIVEKVYHGELKFLYRGNEVACSSYSTTLNAKGEKNWIFLKSKSEPQDVSKEVEYLIYETDCNQMYKEGKPL